MNLKKMKIGEELVVKAKAQYIDPNLELGIADEVFVVNPKTGDQFNAVITSISDGEITLVKKEPGSPPSAAFADRIEASTRKEIHIGLKEGQLWTNKKDKIFILKKWSDRWITKDKYGDRKKFTEPELVALIQSNDFKLEKDPIRERALRQALFFLAPFIPWFGLAILKKLLYKFT